ncbi:MAG TPA: hypothetical protein DDW23_06755 [Planctomycetes bacterium]|nr:hypothetical protein [Planctomycetota bacterium]
MTDFHELDNLPPGVLEELRSLGGEVAPPELWDRLSLNALGQAEAPGELWERVRPSVESPAPPIRRPFAFSASQIIASAAAVILFVGVLFFASERTTSSQPLTADVHSSDLREVYRARVFAVEVAPESLSGVGRHLAGLMGASGLPEETG